MKNANIFYLFCYFFIKKIELFRYWSDFVILCDPKWPVLLRAGVFGMVILSSEMDFLAECGQIVTGKPTETVVAHNLHLFQYKRKVRDTSHALNATKIV